MCNVVRTAKRSRPASQQQQEEVEKDDIAYGYKGDYGSCETCKRSLDAWETLGMTRCPPCTIRIDTDRRVAAEQKSGGIRTALLVPQDVEQRMAFIDLGRDADTPNGVLDALVAVCVPAREDVYAFLRTDKKKVYAAMMDDMALSKYDSEPNVRATRIAKKMGVFKEDELFCGPILFCGPNRLGNTTLYDGEVDRFMRWAELE